jgi:hypothetical protein
MLMIEATPVPVTFWTIVVMLGVAALLFLKVVLGEDDDDSD